MPEKNEEIEQPIPTEWRSIIAKIVEDIRDRQLLARIASDFEIDIDSSDYEAIYESLNSYGDPLVSLPKEAWETSVCRWMGSHWHLLIDLFTEEEGASDLVLFVDVYEDGGSKRFKIQSVHVP